MTWTHDIRHSRIVGSSGQVTFVQVNTALGCMHESWTCHVIGSWTIQISSNFHATLCLFKVFVPARSAVPPNVRAPDFAVVFQCCTSHPAAAGPYRRHTPGDRRLSLRERPSSACCSRGSSQQPSCCATNLEIPHGSAASRSHQKHADVPHEHRSSPSLGYGISRWMITGQFSNLRCDVRHRDLNLRCDVTSLPLVRSSGQMTEVSDRPSLHSASCKIFHIGTRRSLDQQSTPSFKKSAAWPVPQAVKRMSHEHNTRWTHHDSVWLAFLVQGQAQGLFRNNISKKSSNGYRTGCNSQTQFCVPNFGNVDCNAFSVIKRCWHCSKFLIPNGGKYINYNNKLNKFVSNRMFGCMPCQFGASFLIIETMYFPEWVEHFCIFPSRLCIYCFGRVGHQTPVITPCIYSSRMVGHLRPRVIALRMFCLEKLDV